MTEQASVERGIKRVWNVTHGRQGGSHIAGLVLEPGNWKEFDPFLMLAEDWFERGTFDFHPHRGMETITFVIEGILEHNDNHGGKGELRPGDVQWMTAGRGIIHAEEPKEGVVVHSLQLWLNLPSSKKMTEPRYQDLYAKDMPVREEEGALVRIFSGSSAGIKAPTINHVPVTMVEVVLEAGASITQDLPSSYNGFIYVLEGSGTFGVDRTEGKEKQVLWLGSAEGSGESEITIRANEKLRAILYAGEPIGEPVVARGPFVMNTADEIRQAYDDYLAGKFNT